MMFLSAFVGTPSTLQPHFFPKAITLGIPRIDESNGTYNYANTIWVQDQAFMNWHKAWVWITKITNIVTRKDCTIDLATQLIENLNTLSKIAIKVDKLLNKDWGNVEISKDEKNVLQKRLVSYVKAAKANSKRYANCFERIKQTWSVNNCNTFYWLHYSRSSETFFGMLQWLSSFLKLPAVNKIR